MDSPDAQVWADVNEEAGAATEALDTARRAIYKLLAD